DRKAGRRSHRGSRQRRLIPVYGRALRSTKRWHARFELHRAQSARYSSEKLHRSVDTLFAVEPFERVGRALSATQASCVHECPMADNVRPTRLVGASLLATGL